MKKYCKYCHNENFDFIPIINLDGEECGRECQSCGAQELYEDFYFDDTGNISKIENNDLIK